MSLTLSALSLHLVVHAHGQSSATMSNSFAVNFSSLPSVRLVSKEAAKSKCTVCLKPFSWFERVRRLPCRHLFHDHCLLRWMLLKFQCPNCRQVVFNLPRNIATNLEHYNYFASERSSMFGRATFEFHPMRDRAATTARVIVVNNENEEGSGGGGGGGTEEEETNIDDNDHLGAIIVLPSPRRDSDARASLSEVYEANEAMLVSLNSVDDRHARNFVAQMNYLQDINDLSDLRSRLELDYDHTETEEAEDKTTTTRSSFVRFIHNVWLLVTLCCR